LESASHHTPEGGERFAIREFDLSGLRMLGFDLEWKERKQLHPFDHPGRLSIASCT
jgi:hypothetical protein